MSSLVMSREELKNIIRDELNKYLEEEEILTDANLYHKKDGTFGSKKTGNVKSLSKPAADRLNIDQKHVGKGIVANDPEKTRVRYNMADCGRVRVSDGGEHDIKYRCRDYPKRYDEKLDPKAKRQAEIAYCRKLGLRYASEVIEDFLKRTNAASLASKGELYKKAK